MGLLLILTALMVAVSSVVAVVSLRHGWLYSRRRRTIIVHTHDEHTISGVLASVDRGGLVLINAKHVDAGVDLKGELFVPRDEVRFVQVIR